MSNQEDIAQYYDTNTRHFLRFGGSGNTAAIHRAVWAPGVKTKAQAFGYLNALIAKELTPLAEPGPQAFSLLDLGCGVGGTATALHQQLGINVTGISLSAEQVSIARTRAQSLGVSQHVQFLQADFSHMPEQTHFDAACAIESFVHCQNASHFFEMVAQRLKPGGKLILCDDFLHSAEDKVAQRYRARFTQGWQINQLISVEALAPLAAQHGFRLCRVHDLSEYIRAFPAPLLWAVNQLTRLSLPWQYWYNLSGGSSLQYCLKNGWTRYCAVVLELA